MKEYYNTGIYSLAKTLHKRGWSEDDINFLATVATTGVEITFFLLLALYGAGLASAVIVPYIESHITQAQQKLIEKFINIDKVSTRPDQIAYKEWATAGALECSETALPLDMGLHVAKFLNRHDAETLSKVCKSANYKSSAARDNFPNFR